MDRETHGKRRETHSHNPACQPESDSWLLPFIVDALLTSKPGDSKTSLPFPQPTRGWLVSGNPVNFTYIDKLSCLLPHLTRTLVSIQSLSGFLQLTIAQLSSILHGAGIHSCAMSFLLLNSLPGSQPAAAAPNPFPLHLDSPLSILYLGSWSVSGKREC